MRTATEVKIGLTVSEVARRLRVGEDKVRGWIRRGELVAINTASALCGKPRWVITPEALAAFEEGRKGGPPPETARRKRRPAAKDYFPDWSTTEGRTVSTDGHTNEPWSMTEERGAMIIHGADGMPVLRLLALTLASIHRRPDAERVANLRRIVAAVNACAGIPTESLESVVEIGKTPAGRLASLALAAQHALNEVVKQTSQERGSANGR